MAVRYSKGLHKRSLCKKPKQPELNRTAIRHADDD